MHISKLKLEDAIRSTTMFLNDPTIENLYERKIVDEMAGYKKMNGIATKEGLEAFISAEPSSIKKIITVLGISGEKFKRVVTMVRVDKGYTFDSEWDESRLRNELCEKPDLMSEFCELLLNGRDLEKFKKRIPKFILNDFRIDQDILNRLCNEDILRKLTKSSISSAYNKAYSDYYARQIIDRLMGFAERYGLHYQCAPVEGMGTTSLHALTNTESFIIVNFQFNLTTSKGQTEYAEKNIKPLRAKSGTKTHIVMVNMLDGAGWVARAADYKKIYLDCDYFLNLKTIQQLDNIIKQTFNIG